MPHPDPAAPPATTGPAKPHAARRARAKLSAATCFPLCILLTVVVLTLAYPSARLRPRRPAYLSSLLPSFKSAASASRAPPLPPAHYPACAAAAAADPPSAHPPFRAPTPPPALPPSLARYVRWHARARACLLSAGRDAGCARVAAGSDGARARVPGALVWRCRSRSTCAGFGDRLRGIDALLLMAVATRRLFFIDFRQGVNDVAPVTLAVTPALIDWSLPPHLAHTDPASTTLPFLNWHNVHSPHALPAFPPRAPPFDPYVHAPRRAFGNASVVAVACNVGRNVFAAIRRTPYLTTELDLRSRTQTTTFISSDLSPHTLPDLQLARAFAQILYTPSASVSTRAHALLNAVAPPPRPGSPAPPFAAVHVRTGAQLGEGDVGRFSTMRDAGVVRRALLACVHEALANCSPVTGSACEKRDTDANPYPSTRGMFITGDDPAVKYAVAEAARRDGFHPVVVAGPAAHVGLPPRSSAQTPAAPRPAQACTDLLDVFVDLVVMSRAQLVVSTGSGFARAAYLWGNASSLHFAFTKHGAPACLPVAIR